ncbi:MAG: hypothetical protein LBV45_10165, partial [Xanthomonadaceae bacterium]|nr:hypothetical protein [Xanthomonadaceae bacterium]
VDRLDVSSPRDGGYLWSGDKTGAARIAESRGGVTLETTKGGRVVDDWGYLNDKLPWPRDVPDPPGEQFWGSLSKKYAGQLSGDVTALQTPDKAGGGYIFKKYEYPEVWRRQDRGIITSFTEEVIKN